MMHMPYALAVPRVGTPVFCAEERLHSHGGCQCRLVPGDRHLAQPASRSLISDPSLLGAGAGSGGVETSGADGGGV